MIQRFYFNAKITSIQNNYFKAKSNRVKTKFQKITNLYYKLLKKIH